MKRSLSAAAPPVSASDVATIRSLRAETDAAIAVWAKTDTGGGVRGELYVKLHCRGPLCTS